MAKRGRPCKPVTPVTVAPGVPDCPAFIGQRGREEWARVVAALSRSGVLSLVDRGVLAIYCQAWDEFHELTAAIGKKWIITTTHGNVIPNPALGSRNSAADRMQKSAMQLGFTPASRERLKAPKDGKAAGALDRLLSGGNA